MFYTFKIATCEACLINTKILSFPEKKLCILEKIPGMKTSLFYILHLRTKFQSPIGSIIFYFQIRFGPLKKLGNNVWNSPNSIRFLLILCINAFLFFSFVFFLCCQQTACNNNFFHFTVTSEHLRNKTLVKYFVCPTRESSASQLRLTSAENPVRPVRAVRPMTTSVRRRHRVILILNRGSMFAFQ